MGSFTGKYPIILRMRKHSSRPSQFLSEASAELTIVLQAALC